MWYYIYEIPGMKIGCTIDPKRRKRHMKLWYDEIVVLEKHRNIDIASRREHELQEEHGYHVDKNLYSSHHQPEQNERRKKKRNRGGWSATARKNHMIAIARTRVSRTGTFKLF